MDDRQTSLDLKLSKSKNINTKYILSSFSADSIAEDYERIYLEQQYKNILEITDKQSRRSVSFQLNKNRGVFGWFKYREGFSPDLVETYLSEANIQKGDLVLDPFMGSGTTALAASKLGYSSIGFDILPTSKVAIQAKSKLNNYDPNEINMLIKWLRGLNIPKGFNKQVNFVNITYSAYPNNTDKDLAYLQTLIFPNKTNFSDNAISLLKLATLNSLEDLSYTKKDGQYLRWDERSKKVHEANEIRSQKGRQPIKNKLNKGQLPSAFSKISDELEIILEDIISAQNDKGFEVQKNNSVFINNTVLEELPKLMDNSISAVITSPPYLNRYDYTRTYALELAFLGYSEKDFKNARQQLFSSTVENKSKIDLLSEYYSNRGLKNRFNYILENIDTDPVLREVNEAMEKRLKIGDLNNKGVVQMVKGYFEELGFVIAELHRVLKKDATVVIVNDNVRYGGEVIPVDFITMHLAEKFGFVPDKIQTIEQQKGNSSQQMKKFGRVPLRKSITVWHK